MLGRFIYNHQGIGGTFSTFDKFEFGSIHRSGVGVYSRFRVHIFCGIRIFSVLHRIGQYHRVLRQNDRVVLLEGNESGVGGEVLARGYENAVVLGRFIYNHQGIGGTVSTFDKFEFGGIHLNGGFGFIRAFITAFFFQRQRNGYNIRFGFSSFGFLSSFFISDSLDNNLVVVNHCRGQYERIVILYRGIGRSVTIFRGRSFFRLDRSRAIGRVVNVGTSASKRQFSVFAQHHIGGGISVCTFGQGNTFTGIFNHSRNNQLSFRMNKAGEREQHHHSGKNFQKVCLHDVFCCFCY